LMEDAARDKHVMINIMGTACSARLISRMHASLPCVAWY
jgi:hypothetical protein